MVGLGRLLNFIRVAGTGLVGKAKQGSSVFAPLIKIAMMVECDTLPFMSLNKVSASTVRRGTKSSTILLRYAESIPLCERGGEYYILWLRVSISSLESTSMNVTLIVDVQRVASTSKNRASGFRVA